MGHLFQFRFGDTQPFTLCPPPYLINVATLLELKLNLFWVHDEDCVTASVRDIYRMEFEVFQSLGWCLFYISSVTIFATRIGYIMTAFISMIYISFPVYTHLFAMSDGNI